MLLLGAVAGAGAGAGSGLRLLFLEYEIQNGIDIMLYCIVLQSHLLLTRLLTLSRDRREKLLI